MGFFSTFFVPDGDYPPLTKRKPLKRVLWSVSDFIWLFNGRHYVWSRGLLVRRIVYFGLLFLVVVAAPRYSWLSLAAAATAVFVLVHEVRFNGAPVISGLLWCLSGALCGGFLVVAGTSSQFGSVKGKEGLQQAPVIWRGRVEGFVERTRWGTRWVMTCPGNDSGKCLAQSRGKTSSRLLPGDLVVINGKVQKPDSAMNPHEFAYDEYLRARSIKGIVVVRQFRLIGKSLRPVDLVLRPVGRIRYRVSDLLGSPEVSASSRAVLSALLLGERSTVTARQRRLFTRTGTAHLLAVSGLHLACFFLFALWLTERIPVATKLGGWMLWRHFIAWSAALLFMLLAYWPTSCVRAGIMLTGYLMARLLNRDFDAWSWLIVSGLCILAVRPDALSEPGYQLSTVAAGALILVFSAPREDWPVQAGPDLPNPVIEWVYRYMRGIVLGTTVATMATMPLVWYHFGVITPVGLAANLVAVPVVSLLVLPCAIGGLVVGMLVPASTPYTMNLLNELLFILGAFLEWVESSDCYWMPPWPGLFLALVLSVIILGNFLARSKSSRLAYGLALIAWGMVVFLPQGTQRSAGTTVRFFHTGNSDASLLTLPCGHHLLIDGGGPGSGNRVLFPYLRREGISRIERMVLSHGHVDHWQGLMDEGGEIRLCEIIINGSQESIKAAEELAGRHSG